MAYALIDTATGNWMSGPYADKPTAGKGQLAVVIPGSFMNGLTTWSPPDKGFIDKPIADQRIYMTMKPTQDGKLALHMSLVPPAVVSPDIVVLSSRGRLPDSWPVDFSLVTEAVVGPDGKSAFQLAQESGYGGTLAQWLASLAGAEGKSAYQVARDLGYGGTATQWLASLKGAKGDKGDAGATTLGTITIAESIALAAGAGVRRVTITTPTAWGVAAGQNLQAFATAVPSGSYALHDVIATGGNTISVAVSTPALAVLASYSITARLVRIG